MNFKHYKTTPTIALIGVSWLLASKLLSALWEYGWFQGIGPGVVVGLFFLAYDKWLWNIPVLKWLNTMPNLNGQYSGEIRFHWDGKDHQRDFNMRIQQTCSRIRISSSFPKENENPTNSTSMLASVVTDEHGDQTLYFYYHNPGSCMSGDTLDSHDGMNVLRILRDKEATTLEGYYFTNRSPKQTKGCMKVTKPN